MEAGDQRRRSPNRGRQLAPAMRWRTGSFVTLDTADNAGRENEVVSSPIHDRGSSPCDYARAWGRLVRPALPWSDRRRSLNTLGQGQLWQGAPGNNG